MSACWVCDGPVEPFYTVRDIPSASCVLIDTREDALAHPRGSLTLAVCPRCGFIQNDSFDADLVDYEVPYEESQGGSTTFRAFADGQIARLRDRYELDGGVLVEVGCGKAEWLAMACAGLGMRGVGIDPAYVPGRVSDDIEAEYEVLVDYYDAASDLHGDLVACRHTLEHVPNVAEFTSWLGASAQGGDPGIVFIEVPDTLRILEEGAFWDVYYEHCAYFTEISLHNLLASQGLAGSIRLGFDDQYLLAEASAASQVPEPRDARSVYEAAMRFGTRAQEAVGRWSEVVASHGAENVALWAATSKTVAFEAAVGAPFVAAVDINQAKHGSHLPGSGTPVLPPQRLTDIDPDLVIVMNPIYRDEITRDLRNMGLTAKVLALGDT